MFTLNLSFMKDVHRQKIQIFLGPAKQIIHMNISKWVRYRQGGVGMINIASTQLLGGVWSRY